MPVGAAAGLRICSTSNIFDALFGNSPVLVNLDMSLAAAFAKDNNPPPVWISGDDLADGLCTCPRQDMSDPANVAAVPIQTMLGVVLALLLMPQL
jgi:hypothetical protein